MDFQILRGSQYNLQHHQYLRTEGGGFSVLCGIKVKRFLRHLYMSACVLRDNAYRMGTDPWHYELLRRLDDERKSCRTC